MIQYRDQTGRSGRILAGTHRLARRSLQQTCDLGQLGQPGAWGGTKAHHVAETTGLGPRGDLGRDEDDVLRFNNAQSKVNDLRCDHAPPRRRSNTGRLLGHLAAYLQLPARPPQPGGAGTGRLGASREVSRARAHHRLLCLRVRLSGAVGPERPRGGRGSGDGEGLQGEARFRQVPRPQKSKEGPRHSPRGWRRRPSDGSPPASCGEGQRGRQAGAGQPLSLVLICAPVQRRAHGEGRARSRGALAGSRASGGSAHHGGGGDRLHIAGLLERVRDVGRGPGLSRSAEIRMGMGTVQLPES